VRFKARDIIALLNTEILASSAAGDLDVYLRLFLCLCRPVYVAALRRADSPFEESH
jgi:hypothetical protein